MLLVIDNQNLRFLFFHFWVAPMLVIVKFWAGIEGFPFSASGHRSRGQDVSWIDVWQGSGGPTLGENHREGRQVP